MRKGLTGEPRKRCRIHPVLLRAMLLQVALLRALGLADKTLERLLARVASNVLQHVAPARDLLATKVACPVAVGQLPHAFTGN